MALCDLQTFIDCLEDTVVVIDEDFRVLLANTATLRTFGWKAEEVVSQPCYVTFHDQTAPCDSGPFGMCAVQTARATGKPACVRHRHPDSSGFVHTVEIFASPLPTHEGGSTLVVELMREITHQAELEVETAQRHWELSVLNQITTAVARSLDPQTLAPELLDLMAAALQASSAAIYQYRDGAPVLLAGRGTQLPPAAVKALADEVIQRGALALDDLRAAREWAALLPAAARSCACRSRTGRVPRAYWCWATHRRDPGPSQMSA